MKSCFIPKLSLAWVALSTMLLLSVTACGGGGPEELEIPVKLTGGRLDPETIQVGQGDTVTLMIGVDEPGQIHLHGYDIEKDVEPGEIAKLLFVADATGRFKITYHPSGDEHGSSHNGGHSHDGPGQDEEGEEVDVGFLEVLPR